MKLIDKDKVVAEVKKRIKGLKDCHADTVAGYAGEISGLERLLSFLDTIETKEVDEIIKTAEDHAYFAGSENTRKNLWHPADGDDLPEIDREVIVLLSNNKVCFAHRPQEYWDGKNIATEEITRYYPKRYDKGGWNIPDVKWWLDLDLPNMEE